MLRLKFRRLELDLTLRGLAARCGINHSMLCQMESGRLNPRPAELVRLGKALGCKPERLLDHVSSASLGDGAELRDSVRS